MVPGGATVTRIIVFRPNRLAVFKQIIRVSAKNALRIDLRGRGTRQDGKPSPTPTVASTPTPNSNPLSVNFFGGAVVADRSVNIGEILIGAQKRYQLSLFSAVNRPLDVSITTSGTLSVAPPNRTFTIGARGSEALTLSISPTQAGEHQAILNIRSGSYSRTIEIQALGVATNSERVAVVLLEYPGATAQSVELVNSAMFTASNSVGSFFDVASFGRLRLSGQVFGPVTMSAPPFGCPSLTLQQLADTVASIADPRQFTKFLAIYYQTDDKCSAGNSSFEREPYVFQGAEYSATRSHVFEPFYAPLGDFSQTTQSTVAHELIHSMGVSFHAVSYRCSDSTLRPDGVGCLPGAYGDLFDMMGLRTVASHPSPFIKRLLGWIPANEVRRVERSETVLLDASDLPASIVRALEIPLRTRLPLTTASGSATGQLSIRSLLLEQRSLSGFDYRRSLGYTSIDDAFIPLSQEAVSGLLVRAIACREDNDAECFAYLLDLRPNSLPNNAYPPFEFLDAALPAGQSWSVPGEGIVIGNGGYENGKMIVQVAIGE